MEKEVLSRYVRPYLHNNGLKKPLLIISKPNPKASRFAADSSFRWPAITDGDPTAEPRDKMKQVIKQIYNDLKNTAYTPDAVSFMFS